VCFGESYSVNLFCLRRASAFHRVKLVEAVELLKEKRWRLNTFSKLRKLRPIRQIEPAERMVAMNNFSTTARCAPPGSQPTISLRAGKSKT
jgi:hypothetical protein